MIDTEKLGEAVKRTRGDMSLADLAKKLHVSKSLVWRTEQGGKPSLRFYIILCDWMRVSCDHFLLRKRKLSPKKVVIDMLRSDPRLSIVVTESIVKMIEIAYDK